MAVPRVFLSSTFFDLKQVRNNIGDFIKGLGYEPVMHEKSSVAYTHTTPLENDCYRELTSCEIVVCIIGNHFGSQSSGNDLSITMNEVNTAIKSRKIVYIFISSDVYTEHRTYLLNKDTGTFKSAYTDDIRIHEFIEELNTVKNHVILPFETTGQIVDTLKIQFAGLFQNFLQREASVTEVKTAYDLQLSADRMKEAIRDFERQKDEFFAKFDSSILIFNQVVAAITSVLGMKHSSVFVRDLEALDEFMQIMGFAIEGVDNPSDDARKYVRDYCCKKSTLIIKNVVINDDKTFARVNKRYALDSGIVFREENHDEDIIPF